MSWQEPQYDRPRRRRERSRSQSRDERDFGRQALPPSLSNFRNTRQDLSGDIYRAGREQSSISRYTERQRAIPSSDASAGPSYRRPHPQSAHVDEEYSSSEEDSLEDNRRDPPRLHRSDSNTFSSRHHGHTRSPIRNVQHTGPNSLPGSRPVMSSIDTPPPIVSFAYDTNGRRNELDIDLRPNNPPPPASALSPPANVYPPYGAQPSSSFPIHDSPVGANRYSSPRARAVSSVDPVTDLSKIGRAHV